MRMFNPMHPGEFIVDCVLPALGVEMIELADRMNIAPAMMAGRMNSGSRADRSWIQKANGACRISTLSSSTW